MFAGSKPSRSIAEIKPMPRLSRQIGLASLVTAASWLPQPAAAHPHVWVTAETTMLFEQGSVSALRQKWTFDDMYTAMAIQGLDTNKDGVYDRQELTELAQINIEGLKEFEYFTFVKLGDQRLKTKPPVDYHLEHTKDGMLSLYFTLPLEKPVLAEAKGFGFQVSDPGYFIAFEFAKTDPIKLGPGAPAGCQPKLGAAEQDTADVQRLGESFFAQMGGSPGFSVAQTASLACPQ